MADQQMIRIGILGAARIAPDAVIRPARRVAGVEIAAVAARDRTRAEAFAAKHGIPRVHDDYATLVEDPDIDAVYIPLPNGLHGTWTTRALAAHKHVLCEKPFTANATEAAQVAAVAATSDRVVMEAFHWRYHPLNVELLDRVAQGWFGDITRIEGTFNFPMLDRGDIRWDRHLAGGSLMDLGCYPLNMVRAVLAAADQVEPAVTDAKAAFTSRGVDRTFTGHLTWGEGTSATIRCAMLSALRPIDLHLHVKGTRGSVVVLNPVSPQLGGTALYHGPEGRQVAVAKRLTSYTAQMTAFRDAILHDTPYPSTPADAVANMALIDALYESAGVTPLQPTAVQPTAVQPTAVQPTAADPTAADPNPA